MYDCTVGMMLLLYIMSNFLHAAVEKRPSFCVGMNLTINALCIQNYCYCNDISNIAAADGSHAHSC